MDAKQKWTMTVIYGQGYSDKWLASKMNAQNLQGLIDRAHEGLARIERGDEAPMNRRAYNYRIRIATELLQSLSK